MGITFNSLGTGTRRDNSRPNIRKREGNEKQPPIREREGNKKLVLVHSAMHSAVHSTVHTAVYIV